MNDKLIHFGAGGATALVFLLLHWLALSFSPWLACLLAGTIVGVGYEAQQRWRGEGNSDSTDAFATILGAWAVCILGAITHVYLWDRIRRVLG